ncbi:MAG: hypothetical protein KJ066_20070 [Acidobacteria bacterium]|nr:hypothetical protein [Acidobacteriota bacterium]
MTGQHVGLSAGQWVGIGLTVLAISLGHYETSVHAIVLHEVFTRLYYLPIVFAALLGGTGAGLATAGLATVLYLPHVIFGWHASPAVQVGQYAEVAVFILIGGVAGRIGGQLRTQRDRARAATAQLEEALDRLQTSLEERRQLDQLVTIGQLAAGMAHEIRNPLGAARGALDILEGREVSHERHTEFVAIAREAIMRASLVLDQLLEFAQPRPPAEQQTDLADLVHRSAELTRPTLEERGAQFDVASFPTHSTIVSIDGAQVQRALVMLLLEAPHATGARRIRLEVGGRKGQAVVTIDLDGGDGPRGRIEGLFEPFVDARVGHGLTLALAKRLVENQGGTVHEEPTARGVRIVLRFGGTVGESPTVSGRRAARSPAHPRATEGATVTTR